MAIEFETVQAKFEIPLLSKLFFACLFKYWEGSQLWK